MNYIPLYRKWRSQNFAEIVGQSSIVQTLQNAIKNGRVANAYLFSGPRGTGKTSTARIFAKALNCAKGPAPEPCGTCDQCVKIKNGHAVDVIEIDAASNRGIDEIRDLREKVRYSPVEGKYKVYIIDEVHMLTSEAFNALLKTLEEPPMHVVFILATTEVQKVPVTIASRCQRLDFKRLTGPEVIAQLKKIAQAEGIKLEDDAASLIARNSEGSMRDAISLLDQMVSLSGKSVGHDDVILVLGTAGADTVFEFGEKLGKGDSKALMDLIGKMSDEGRSIPQVTREILLHLRNLLFVKLGNESVIEESTEHINKLKAQSGSFDQAQLKGMMRMLSKAEVDMKWHPQTRLLLEIAVMEAVSMISEPSVSVKPAQKEKAVEQTIKQTYTPAPQPKAVVAAGFPDLKAKWDNILAEVKKKNAFAYISLHEGEPVSMTDGDLTLRFKKGFAFHKTRLEESASKKIVEEVLTAEMGRPVRINCVIEAETKPHEASASKAVEIFNGTLIS